MLIVKYLPMRIGLGDVTPNGQISCRVVDQQRKMCRKWAILRARNKYAKRISAHEGERDGAIFDSVDFRNVHSTPIRLMPSNFLDWPNARLRLLWHCRILSINCLEDPSTPSTQQLLSDGRSKPLPISTDC